MALAPLRQTHVLVDFVKTLTCQSEIWLHHGSRAVTKEECPLCNRGGIYTKFFTGPSTSRPPAEILEPACDNLQRTRAALQRARADPNSVPADLQRARGGLSCVRGNLKRAHAGLRRAGGDFKFGHGNSKGVHAGAKRARGNSKGACTDLTPVRSNRKRARPNVKPPRDNLKRGQMKQERRRAR